MSIYAAAKVNGIPKTTLLRHLKTPNKIFAVGKPTALTSMQEGEIVKTCQIFAEWGFGLTKKDIINVIADYYKHTKTPNCFKNGIPGDDWWTLFIQRHPELVKTKTTSTTDG